MLDLLRKRARSWVTYVIFAVVILVFVFFFGYSDIGGGRHGQGETVAKVNGMPITTGELQLAVENNIAFYKETFKGELPESVAKGVRPATLQQLINQRLLLQAAHATGLRVSDTEIAEKIRSLPYLQKDGRFDAALYHDAFRPQLLRRYRVDFEDLMASELTVQRFHDLLKEAIVVLPVEAKRAFAMERSQWSFEAVDLDPDQMAKEKKIAAADAEKIAAELHAAMPQPKAKEKLLGTYGLTARKVGPIPFTARTQLLGTDATAEQYREVFALDPARPMPAAPLRVGKKWIVVRLTKLEQPDDAAWQKEATQFTDRLRREQEEGRTRQLLATLTSQAHIRRYLADEE